MPNMFDRRLVKKDLEEVLGAYCLLDLEKVSQPVPREVR